MQTTYHSDSVGSTPQLFGAEHGAAAYALWAVEPIVFPDFTLRLDVTLDERGFSVAIRNEGGAMLHDCTHLEYCANAADVLSTAQLAVESLIETDSDAEAAGAASVVSAAFDTAWRLIEAL